MMAQLMACHQLKTEDFCRFASSAWMSDGTALMAAINPKIMPSLMAQRSGGCHQQIQQLWVAAEAIQLGPTLLSPNFRLAVTMNRLNPWESCLNLFQFVAM
ncbi:MAG: hypothetical protein ACJ8AW_31450 [Rhodopila sp.]